MKIAIDISQIVYSGGVPQYLSQIVKHLITLDTENEYIFFGSTLRQKEKLREFYQQFQDNPRVHLKLISLPSKVLDMLWNRLHIFPIEFFTGKIDIYLSSDWTQAPTKAKTATILYDLIVYTYPEEMAKEIVEVQKRRMKWVKKDVQSILCISEATKKDAITLLNIPANRLHVVYPGF